MVARSAGKVLIVEDFDASDIDWVCEAALEGIFGHQVLQFVHESRMIQHVTQARRRRFGHISSILDLVLLIIPKDMRNLDLEHPVCSSDQAAFRMRLSLQGLAAPDKYDRKFSEMDKNGLLNLGFRTRGKVCRGSNYVNRQ